MCKNVKNILEIIFVKKKMWKPVNKLPQSNIPPTMLGAAIINIV